MLSANPSDPAMCPVRRLEHYIQARTRAGVVTEYLFAKKDGSAMAKSTPCGIVQKMVEAANHFAMRHEGIEEKWGAPDVYGSHSLRRGGVTEARASGVEMLEIQRHGRWKSMAVWGYVGPTDAQRRLVTANIFGAGERKHSMSAPNTPVKPPKTPRKPRASPTKLKRKLAESDDEAVPDEVKQEEKLVDELQMAEWNQGHGEQVEDAAAATKESKKEGKMMKARKKQKVAHAAAAVVEVKVVDDAATVSATPRRTAAKKANAKMSGQR